MLLLLLRKKWSNSFAGSIMCSNLFFRFVNICFLLTLSPPPFSCVCKAFVANNSLSSAPLNQTVAPVPGCRHSSCVLIIHVCLCVCASVCACENV